MAEKRYYKGLISHYLKTHYLLKFMIRKIIQSTRIHHWNTYNRPWYFATFLIVLTALALIFLFHFFPFFCLDLTYLHGVSLKFSHKRHT